MSILKIKKALILLGLVVGGSGAYSQEAEVKIEQDPKIPALLEMKTQLSKDSKLKDRYKIQLFSGQIDKANELLESFRELPFEWSSSIEYETPNYKVWIGNFRNRLEADRALQQIKTSFPNAFIFRPDRN